MEYLLYLDSTAADVLKCMDLEYIKSMIVGGVLFAPYDDKMLTSFIFSLTRSIFLSESS